MALRIAIDTNCYSDFVSGEAAAVAAVREARVIVVPFIVLAELRAGFRLGRRGAENERELNVFLRSARVSVLFAEEATTHIWAEILATLRRRGTPIPTQDIWIAALAIQHDLTLLTRDKHFDLVPRLARM